MTTKTCSKCRLQFEGQKDPYCKNCRARYNKVYFLGSQGTHLIKEKLKKFTSHKYRLLMSSKCNAQNKGLLHLITESDIELPKTCLFLGIDLNYHKTGTKGARPWDAPSIDRIDSTKGYVPGNVQVISDLANRMQQNATPEQLLKFARNVLKIYG